MGRQHHNGKIDPKRLVCTHCLQGNCNRCVDTVHIVLGMDCWCQCKRKEHSGEPNTQQIRDPETGTVYAPGLKVTEDGKVEKL